LARLIAERDRMKIWGMLAIVAVAGGGLPAAVLAQNRGETIEDMITLCESESFDDRTYCLGIVRGVSSTLG